MVVRYLAPLSSNFNSQIHNTVSRMSRLRLAATTCLMLGSLSLFVSVLVSADERGRNDAETRLLHDLFQNYSPQVRPSRTKRDPVNMTFGIAYVQLVQLDDRSQMLVSNVWIRQKWTNYLLRWDPDKYDNIKVVNVDPKKVWLPDVVLYNNARKGHLSGTMYNFKTKVVIRYDGGSTWYSPAIIRSGCNIDVTFFPFDDQLCTLEFGSWTYSADSLDLFPMQDQADLSSYLQSAEFDLNGAKCERKALVTVGAVYPMIIFQLKLRRQPGFFLFNVIIPGLVITCFAILTFSSPHLTGERISLAIESFLSLSFLCMMVADSIPVNSDVSPLITKFLLLCMSLISLAVLFNLISLNMTGRKRVPVWLRFIAFEILGPMVGYLGGRSSKIKKNWKRRSDNIKLGHAMGTMGETQTHTMEMTYIDHHQTPMNGQVVANGKSNEGIALYGTNNEAIALMHGYADGMLPEEKLTLHQRNLERRRSPDKRLPSSNNHKKFHLIELNTQAYNKCISDMDDVLMRSWVECDSRFNKEFWRCLAQTVDRIFLILFTLSFTFVSAVMLLKGYGHQVSVRSDKRYT